MQHLRAIREQRRAAFAESLDYAATELEKSLKEGKKLQLAVKQLLTNLIKENKRIIFNGNNYADDWQKEAGKRGLLNHRTSVDAFGEILKPEVVNAFEKYGVLSKRELESLFPGRVRIVNLGLTLVAIVD